MQNISNNTLIMTVLLHKPTPGKVVTEWGNTYRRLTAVMVHAKV